MVNSIVVSPIRTRYVQLKKVVVRHEVERLREVKEDGERGVER